MSARIAELEAWVADLQSGMYVNCVYCGHRYGPGETTPVSMADALKAHIETCPAHPMSALKTQLADAERLLSECGDALGEMVGHAAISAVSAEVLERPYIPPIEAEHIKRAERILNEIYERAAGP